MTLLDPMSIVDKSVRIRSFSCPFFPAFGLNTERYSENTDQKDSEYGLFSRSVKNLTIFHASMSNEAEVVVNLLLICALGQLD